jgi:hypothetical protein
MTADGPKSQDIGDSAAHRQGIGVYGGSVRALSFVFLGLGALILVRTLVAGGGPLSVGVVLGAAFVAVGAVRLWLALRMSR